MVAGGYLLPSVFLVSTAKRERLGVDDTEVCSVVKITGKYIFWK